MEYKYKSMILLNEQETALILGLKSQTLRSWRCTGNGPKYRKIGGSVRYHPSDIENYIEQNIRQSTSEPQEGSDVK